MLVSYFFDRQTKQIFVTLRTLKTLPFNHLLLVVKTRQDCRRNQHSWCSLDIRDETEAFPCLEGIATLI